MRRFISRTLLMFAALSVVAATPAPPPPLPSRIFSQGQQAHWDSLKTKLEERARFFASLAPTTTRRAPDGNTRAMQEQEYAGGSVEALICEVFGPTCRVAVAKARCESGLNPSAYNPSGASGLFQIMLPLHAGKFAAHGWSASDWADPYKNSVVAFGMSHGGTNWSAWSC